MALNTLGESEFRPGACSREFSAHYKKSASGMRAGAEKLFKLGADEDDVQAVLDKADSEERKSRCYALKGFVQTIAARAGLNLG